MYILGGSHIDVLVCVCVRGEILWEGGRFREDRIQMFRRVAIFFLGGGVDSGRVAHRCVKVGGGVIL